MTLTRENEKTTGEAGTNADNPNKLQRDLGNSHGLRSGFDGLKDLMDRLLAQSGCPWDREQTLDSLRPYLIEEAYEVLESMDNATEHCVELGDLLFQIVFQSALRQRQDSFSIEDVVTAITNKMIRRHPHVFSHDGNAEGAKPLSSDEVAKQWSQIKAAEKPKGEQPDPLAGVPKRLPALQRAWRLQDKASAVGFDWPNLQGALDKLDEELTEFHTAIEEETKKEIEEELGDVLFVLVRVGQKLGINAEDALRGTISKFEGRFGHVMKRCHEQGLDPAQAGLEKLDEFWDEAKKLRKQRSDAPNR